MGKKSRKKQNQSPTFPFLFLRAKEKCSKRQGAVSFFLFGARKFFYSMIHGKTGLFCVFLNQSISPVFEVVDFGTKIRF
jgi:hypothetical protein